MKRKCCKQQLGRCRLLMLLLTALLLTRPVAADDDIMRELLQEQQRLEEERMREASHQYEDSDITRMESDREERAQQEQNMLREQEEERNEQIRLQREAQFESEMARLSQEQQKAAKKQKKKDASIVRKVLKAARKDELYAILGLKNFEITIGPVRFLKFKFGPFTFFRPSPKDVKKAYRGLAMRTHPDKNRDGRANEAFLAVEEAASILTDEAERELYDIERKVARLERRDQIVNLMLRVFGTVHSNVARAIGVVRSLLGPFATPIFIIGCLIV